MAATLFSGLALRDGARLAELQRFSAAVKVTEAHQSSCGAPLREKGPLADHRLDEGERVGVMELFAGAIGTYKNPPSHRQVDYADPIEALPMVGRATARIGDERSRIVVPWSGAKQLERRVPNQNEHPLGDREVRSALGDFPTLCPALP